MINPFAKKELAVITHTNSRLGGLADASEFKRLYPKAKISGFNRRARFIVACHRVARKSFTHTPTRQNQRVR